MTTTTPSAERPNGVAVASFVCGVIGVILSIIPPFFIFIVPGLLDILGIVFGVRGRRNAATGARQGGLATAGLVMGVIGLLAFVLWWLLVAVTERGT
jgi:hypothetical protein